MGIRAGKLEYKKLAVIHKGWFQKLIILLLVEFSTKVGPPPLLVEISMIF